MHPKHAMIPKPVIPLQIRIKGNSPVQRAVMQSCIEALVKDNLVTYYNDFVVREDGRFVYNLFPVAKYRAVVLATLHEFAQLAEEIAA